MKLLFFSMWYSPEPVSKPHALAKELVKRGHQITVITGVPNYPIGKVYPGYKSSFVSIEYIDGVRIIRTKFLIDRSRSAIKRILSIFSYSLISFFISMIIEKDYQAVWSYQIGYPATLYSIITKKPHFHEVQDLWPNWAENSLNGINSKLTIILTSFQKAVYKQSKLILTISEGFADAIHEIYGIRKNKILILPNWADNHFLDLDERFIKRSKFNIPENKFIITYGGNIGKAQALESLLYAAKELKSNENILFIIAGDGIEKRRLVLMTLELELKNVIFLPSMNPREMAELLKISDVLYLSLKNDKKYRITIPSKTYAYYAIGKPILASVEGDTAKMIEKDKVGFVVRPENSGQLFNKIKEIYISDKKILQYMGNNAIKCYNEKYSGNEIAEKYVTIFHNFIDIN